MLETIPLAEPWFPPEYADLVRDQVLSGFIGPGKTCELFSAAIRERTGAVHCALTTSGTIALSVAAHAIGLQPGDEVLVPAYGVISTINAFASIGLRPRLVDIDRGTGCIDVDRLGGSIRPETRAVCFVDFSGFTGPNLVRAVEICDAQRIPLIEDAACALGHRFEGRSAGTFGTVGTYSFSVPKVLTTGQGGAVVTSDAAIANRAAAFIDQGDLEWRRTNLNREIGTNLRFNDILAAIGVAQMRDIGARLERRRAVYSLLRDRLGRRLYAVPGVEAPLHNIVFTSEPDSLVAALAASGISAVRQYRTLSAHPAYTGLAGRFPNADHWTSRAVYLPFGMALTLEDASRVAGAVLGSNVPLDEL